MDIILAAVILAVITGTLAALYRTIDADRGAPPRSHEPDIFARRFDLRL